MPHFIQLSAFYWLNADAIRDVQFCVEHEGSPHYHIYMQGEDEDLELTPDQHQAFGVYLKAWSLPSFEGKDPDCPECFMKALEQDLASNTENE